MPEHVHQANREDEDICAECGKMFCLECSATITWNEPTLCYAHPAPLCGLHDAIGSIEAPTEENAR